ncbi:MAG: metallophosphoesterase [Candidatus Sumerlaeaceae bacterium]
MSLFFIVFLSMPLVDLAWWRWADVRLRKLPAKRWLRILLAVFITAQIAQFLYLLMGRGFGVKLQSPMLLLGSAYLWHLIILPVLASCTFAVFLLSAGWRGVRSITRRTANKPATVPIAESSPAISRRQFLLTAGILAPPALCLAATGYGISRRDNFRTRRVEIPMRALPRELDGMTIAHVTDIHLGKFTDERVLKQIVARTNDLRSDVILMTGDLIDFDLGDLGPALEHVKKMDSPGGVFMCEGNHDLFQGRTAFETGVKNSGVPLLLDEAATIRVRGRDVQMLGMKWDAVYRRHLERMQPLRDPDAFQILLAHHPHAFDPAAEFGIPLTLAGHTHGGQLMLTPDFGAGPMMFKYWSGLYRNDDAALVVSNGVGNWFPLRVNAPAEILHITLRAVT